MNSMCQQQSWTGTYKTCASQDQLAGHNTPPGFTILSRFKEQNWTEKRQIEEAKRLENKTTEEERENKDTKRKLVCRCVVCATHVVHVCNTLFSAVVTTLLLLQCCCSAIITVSLLQLRLSIKACKNLPRAFLHCALVVSCNELHWSCFSNLEQLSEN